MAVSPRTLFTNPAAAAVAAVTIFGLTVMATSLCTTTVCDKKAERAPVYVYEVPCASIADQLGERESWDEREWLTYASCFETRNDSRMLVRVTTEALSYHPRSESLWNMKAYHQMVLGEHREAGYTLRAALRLIEPTNGTMENNLAWANLWTGDMPSSQMRLLYAASLVREPKMCEALHTGLMVEYKIASETTSYDRAEALKRLERLRLRYDSCDRKSNANAWDRMVEKAGAVLIYDAYEELMYGSDMDDDTWHQKREIEHHWENQYSAASVGALCAEAVPATLDIDCVKTFNSRILRN